MTYLSCESKNRGCHREGIGGKRPNAIRSGDIKWKKLLLMRERESKSKSESKTESEGLMQSYPPRALDRRLQED